MRLHSKAAAGLIAASALSPTGALAGAWTQPEGSGQIISVFRAYTTDSRYNDGGHKTSQPTYTQYEINPYVEYGLTDEWTIGANLFAQHLDDDTNTTLGVADTELFARRQVYRDDIYALAIQPLIKMPSPQSGSSSPAIGSKYPDLGLHVIGGMSFDAFGRNHYAELETGYRFRDGPPNDQLIINATVGLSVNDEITLMPQVFQTLRLDTPQANSFTQSPQDDYSLTRLQMTALYHISDSQAIQFGGFYNVAGRNTGAGGGLLIGFWKSF